MKLLPKTLFVIYLIALLWLVLLKLSFNLSLVPDVQSRSLNLIPFLYSSTDSLRHYLIEVTVNLVAFIPFGLLLSNNFKRLSFRTKLATILSFSLVIELIQFVFAIGIADITDIITNTLGGVIGLKLYEGISRRMDNKKLDRLITLTGTALLIAFIVLRFFILRHISYHSPH